YLLLLLTVIIQVVPFTAQVNKQVDIVMYQDSLVQLQKKMYKTTSDVERKEISQQFLITMEQALLLENSFNFSFDSLKQIAKLTSSDKKFKIYNWDLPNNDGTYEYAGFIQTYDAKT